VAVGMAQNLGGTNHPTSYGGTGGTCPSEAAVEPTDGGQSGGAPGHQFLETQRKQENKRGDDF